MKKMIKAIKATDLIKEMESQPPLKFIWGGIPEGSKGIFVGVGKTGKTTFAENLAISLAVGRKEFFGEKLMGEPKKVLFVNMEESPILRSRRNKRQIAELSKEEIELFNENYLANPDGFLEYINNDSDWENLKEFILDSGADIIIIDSLSHLFQGSIEKSEKGIEFIQKFRKHVSSLGKTTIVIHHNTKSNNRPLSMEGIAGSRVISQEFEYALGFASIPSRSGGKYANMIFNKHVDNDETIAILYKINEKGWFENISTANKYDLYEPSTFDRRKNNSNKTLILEYIKSQDSQGSQTVSTGEMKKIFVLNEDKTMSKETLHCNLKKLANEGEIVSIKHGEYTLVTNEDEDEKKAS